jgi:hypothetical protein
LIANLDHPIHEALEKLHTGMLALIAGVRSPLATRIRNATARAIAEIEAADAEVRRSRHVWTAIDALIIARGCLRALFLERKVTAEVVDEGRRHLNRMLQALDDFEAADDESSAFELPVLENAPQDLGESSTINRLRAAIAHAAEVVRAVREREPRPPPAKTGRRREAA